MSPAASLVAQQKRIHQQCRRYGFDPWVGRIPWEKNLATHLSILAWKIPGTEDLVSCSPWGRKRVKHDLATKQQQMSRGEGISLGRIGVTGLTPR